MIEINKLRWLELIEILNLLIDRMINNKIRILVNRIKLEYRNKKMGKKKKNVVDCW
jgi:hypothetical protein